MYSLFINSANTPLISFKYKLPYQSELNRHMRSISLVKSMQVKVSNDRLWILLQMRQNLRRKGVGKVNLQLIIECIGL